MILTTGPIFPPGTGFIIGYIPSPPELEESKESNKITNARHMRHVMILRMSLK